MHPCRLDAGLPVFRLAMDRRRCETVACLRHVWINRSSARGIQRQRRRASRQDLVHQAENEGCAATPEGPSEREQRLLKRYAYVCILLQMLRAGSRSYALVQQANAADCFRYFSRC